MTQTKKASSPRPTLFSFLWGFKFLFISALGPLAIFSYYQFSHWSAYQQTIQIPFPEMPPQQSSLWQPMLTASPASEQILRAGILLPGYMPPSFTVRYVAADSNSLTLQIGSPTKLPNAAAVRVRANLIKLITFHNAWVAQASQPRPSSRTNEAVHEALLALDTKLKLVLNSHKLPPIIPPTTTATAFQLEQAIHWQSYQLFLAGALTAADAQTYIRQASAAADDWQATPPAKLWPLPMPLEGTPSIISPPKSILLKGPTKEIILNLVMGLLVVILAIVYWAPNPYLTKNPTPTGDPGTVGLKEIGAFVWARKKALSLFTVLAIFSGPSLTQWGHFFFSEYHFEFIPQDFRSGDQMIQSYPGADFSKLTKVIAQDIADQFGTITKFEIKPVPGLGLIHVRIDSLTPLDYEKTAQIIQETINEVIAAANRATLTPIADTEVSISIRTEVIWRQLGLAHWLLNQRTGQEALLTMFATADTRSIDLLRNFNQRTLITQDRTTATTSFLIAAVTRDVSQYEQARPNPDKLKVSAAIHRAHDRLTDDLAQNRKGTQLIGFAPTASMFAIAGFIIGLMVLAMAELLRLKCQPHKHAAIKKATVP